ncbi:hypothetical protein RDI58_018354 [Solanum bulbocastanum]|uniref:RNA-directed DNA polymerase (Reverse transcriptase) n=1 Tax=Solanum bulbocastanum TaxID=147425 RepID=A0AAN8Y9P1_SOLBU
MKDDPVLNRSQQSHLIAPVSRKEVVKAFQGINDNKAPGCDDFNAYFFKQTWGQLGEEIIDLVLHFFSTSKLCKVINCTTLTLIPKVAQPSKVSEFRPIFCCTLLYKIISKVLTNRMQYVMEVLMDKNQSVFVPDRLINDNII